MTHVAGGLGHTLAATNSGTLWSWGDNRSGQCGLGEQVSRQIGPSMVKTLMLEREECVQSISCGVAHNVLLTTHGRLFTWGCEDSGASGAHGTIQHHPRVMQHPNSQGVSWLYATCGAHHTVAIDTAGHAWAWGRGNDYQLGNLKREASSHPVPIMLEGNPVSDVIAVAAGWAHTFVATKAGME